MLSRLAPQGVRLAAVWRKDEYRAFLLTFFAVGLAISASMPLVTLFLIKDLHVQASVAGLFLLTSLLGPAVSMGTGWLSDRVESRLPLLGFAIVWMAAGWALLAVAGQVWLAFTVGLACFSMIGTISAQVFTCLHDVMTRDGETQENVITSTIRTAYSLGWILGPVLGGWLAATAGLRATFLATAGLYLLSLVPLHRMAIHSISHAASSGRARAGGWVRANTRLLIFVLAAMLVLSGDAIKLAYLPLYIVQGLKQSVVVFGSLLSVSAIVELVVFPLAGVLADRLTLNSVIAGGVGLGVIDYAILATSAQLWQLYVAQLVHVAVIAAMLGLGPTYARHLNRGAPGQASSAFFSAQALSASIGGVIGSYGVQALGLPHVFFLPSAICALAILAILAIHSAPQHDGTCAPDKPRPATCDPE